MTVKKLLSISLFSVAIICCILFSSFAEAKSITLRCVGIDPVEQFSTIEMKEMGAEIEKLTDNEIKMRYFPASQLGDYTLLYEEITKGTIDMGVIPIPTTYEKAHQIVYTPYLATDYNDVAEMFKEGSWLYNTCYKLHDNLGVKFLGFQVHGFGGLGAIKPVVEPLNPDVKKNLLLRISPMELDSYILTEMGYRTVTIPYADLYTSLQAGLCEGWYGGSAAHSYEGFRDVLKQYYAMNIYAEAYSVVVSHKTWDKLTSKQQKAIAEAASNMCANSVITAEKVDADYMDKLEKAGLEVHRYTADELRATAQKIRKEVWPKLAQFYGEEIANELIQQYSSSIN